MNVPLHLDELPPLRLRRRWRVVLWSLLALVVLVVLALGSFTLLMARVPAYRAQMQAWVSREAKLDIQFASLSAGWRGYGPELRFTDATVRSPDGERVLAIAERGSVGFDAWQALRTWHVAAARLSLSGTELKVQRLANGQFEWVGQADWPEYSSDHAFKLESLPVGELVISKVRLSFRDLKTGQGPWVLDQVTLNIARDIKDDEDVLSLRGSAKLPASLGQGLTFAAQGRGQLAKVPQLVWQAQIAGTQLDVQGWRELMSNQLSGNAGHWRALQSGKASFEFKSEFVGVEPTALSGKVDASQLVFNLPTWQTPIPMADPLQVRDDDEDESPATNSNAPALASNDTSVRLTPPPLTYSQLRLDFSAQQVATGWQADIKQWQLSTPEKTWPVGGAQLQWQVDDTNGLQRVQARVDHVVLENLWPLLALLPDNERNARLRALNASGELNRIAVVYERDPTAAGSASPRFGAHGEFRKLGIAPVGRMPGVSGLDGQVSLTGARGELSLDSRDVAFSLPRLFRTPLPADELQVQATWTVDADAIKVSTSTLRVLNADGRAQGSMTLQLPRNANDSPMIELHAVGEDLHAAATPRYLPAGVMKRKSLAWLDNAFPDGRVVRAEATVTGPLRKFPFRQNKGHKPEGLFLINAQIEGLAMNYQAGWLPATALNVQAEFRNEGLSATASSGVVNGMTLTRATGRIADFHDNEIELTADIKGTLTQGLSFVQASPVGPMLGDVFQRLQGSGGLTAHTEMFLPLKQPTQRRIDIEAALSQANVNMPGVDEGITRLNGSLHVHNDGVTAANLRGEFLQGKFVTTAEPRGAGRYHIIATGQAYAAPVTRFLKLPAWTGLTGSTNYRFTLPGYAARNAQGVRRLYEVDSTLEGLGIALPAPVGKSANSARTLHVEAEMLPLSANDANASVNTGATLQWRGAMDSLRALARAQQVEGGLQFDRAGLRADGQAASLPAEAGLRVEGNIDQFVLDDWLHLSNGNTAGVVGANAPSAASATRVQDVLRSANVNVNQFKVFGFVWPQVRAIVQATDAGWRVDVSGNEANGRVLVPYNFDSGKPMTLDMDHLHLQAASASPNAGGADGVSKVDPRDLPALRANVRRFRFADHDFGNLQLAAQRNGRGLMVNELKINGDSFSGVGDGSWLQSSSGPLCTLNFTLQSTDVRATVQQFNYSDVIAARHGKLIAALSWPGGVDENFLARASGTLEFALEDGQLLNLQPGAGRVLGLLSVAALPRRLSLDFSDVTDKGFAFDSLHADFNVKQGDAYTQNLTLRGPAAEVGMVGRLGLGAHDYDQTAVVMGDVGNALPVAGTAVGGPVIGAALLLFTKVFKEPLKGVARAYYHIGGTWDEPKVERIDADVGKASLSSSSAASSVSSSTVEPLATQAPR